MDDTKILMVDPYIYVLSLCPRILIILLFRFRNVYILIYGLVHLMWLLLWVITESVEYCSGRFELEDEFWEACSW